MKETLIATVRHGTTEFNKSKKIAGTNLIFL
jgi:broad specificity phosphatase PhoE